MGTDTKAGYKGYRGGAAPQKVYPWSVALLGDEGLGFDLLSKPNFVAGNERLETTDKQKRREQGYRGL